MQLQWEPNTLLTLSCRGCILVKTQNKWQGKDYLHLLLLRFSSPPTHCYWNQNQPIFSLETDKQAFLYSHRDVGETFIHTVWNASIQGRDSVHTGCNGIEPDCQSLFPECIGTEEEWSAHGTQQQDLLMECFDNVRAPSRLLCEVLLDNLSIVLYITNAVSSSHSFADPPATQQSLALLTTDWTVSARFNLRQVHRTFHWGAVAVAQNSNLAASH